MGSKNGKVQGIVFIKKKERVCCLDIFVIKPFV